jgi:hypothetical protein
LVGVLDPFLGPSSSVYWSLPRRLQRSVTISRIKDLADGCLLGRSTFKEHVDLFNELLVPFVNCDASSYVCESIASFHLSVLLYRVQGEQSVEWPASQLDEMKTTMISKGLQCNIYFLQESSCMGLDVILRLHI